MGHEKIDRQSEQRTDTFGRDNKLKTINLKLSLGFSPCPNDTFIFDALVNKKIDTAGFEFEVMLEDVETLNQWALESRLDITKLSFPAFFQSSDEYVLLNSGSALGKGVGPLLISRSDDRSNKSWARSPLLCPESIQQLIFSSVLLIRMH